MRTWSIHAPLAALALLVLVALAGGAHAQASDPSTFAIDQFNEASELARQGHPEEAHIRFEAAARAGNPNAQFMMGVFAETEATRVASDGMNQHYLQARDWYQLSAAQGYAPALNNLGALYFDGRGVTRDVIEAARLYRQASLSGNAQGSYNLALLIARQQIEGGPAEAIQLLTDASKAGFANAQAQLAKFYLDGDLVEKNLPEAARLFELAAEQDHAQAEYYLATMLRSGQGIKKDPAAAYAWMSIAAGHALPDALCQQADMLDAGEGVATDHALAATAWARAAALGSIEAQQHVRATDGAPPQVPE